MKQDTSVTLKVGGAVTAEQSNLKIKGDPCKILTCVESNAEYLSTIGATRVIANVTLHWRVKMHKNPSKSQIT